VSRVDELLSDLRAWAAARPDVRAALLIGSQARADTPADEWSDVDLALFVDDPRRYADDAAWVARFGTAELTFVEPTAVAGQVERRVLYSDGLEVDFALMPAAGLPAVLADPDATSVIARGYVVLHDEIGLGDALAEVHVVPAPETDVTGLVQDFWYHALWTAKKHRRGESITARDCLECVLKPRLVALAREQTRRRDPAADTWHRDRFVERWADESVVSAIWGATAATSAELPGALWELCDAFDRVAAEIAPPDPGVIAARRRLEALLPRS